MGLTQYCFPPFFKYLVRLCRCAKQSRFTVDDQFQRISRLPPYVFNIIGDLKQQARAAGEDIIDFGMGNPDQPTPEHIVDKLVETARRGDTHRYSQSKGIPRLRKAICDWYQRRYDVTLDPDSEAIVTLGSKEGLAHLALATTGPGDAILVPNPSYPIHPYGFVISGADIRHVPMGEDERGIFCRAGKGHTQQLAAAEDAGAEFSLQPDHPLRGTGILTKKWWPLPGNTISGWCRTWPMPTCATTATSRPLHPAGGGCPGCGGGIFQHVQEL